MLTSRENKKWFRISVAILLCLTIEGMAQANTTWQEKAKLTASDANGGDFFSYSSVSISGDRAIVGAPYNDDNGRSSGSAYIFKRSDDVNDPNWYQQAKLTASDAAAENFFGYSVSISGDYAIVGAYGNDANGYNFGAAYIFTPNGIDPNNWDQQAKLLASDGNDFDHFGFSVSVSGDYAILGAPQDDDPWPGSGSAYIFKRSSDPNDPNWYEQAKLFDPTGLKSYLFGWSVSISGDFCIIGIPYWSHSGAVIIFKREGTNWLPQTGYFTGDATAKDRLGYSVSISADYAIAGAPFHDANEPNSGAAYIRKRNGDDWSWWAKLTAPDGAAEDLFGWSVSISGDLAIIGAVGNDHNEPNSGSAYIFKCTNDTWSQVLKITASDAAAQDCFGGSVSLSPDYALVGALSDDNGTKSGSAYVFERVHPTGDLDSDYCVNWHDVNVLTEQWLDPFQAKLTAADGAASDWFGCSVSISGDYAVVGAHRDDGGGTRIGSAYIFKRDGKSWTQQPKLTAPDAAAEARFGYSVSINADNAIVSAPYDDDLGYMSGSAYIFERSDDVNDPNWYQQAKLLASDGAPYRQFGQAVSLDANYAVVGAPLSAYIFKRSDDVNDPNWYEQTKLNAPDPNNIYSGFGTTVSISNDYLIIGEASDDENGPYSGSAFIYKRSADANDPNWYQQTKLLASDGNDYDYFGYSVSLNGNYAIVGAYGDEDNGYSSGSAFIFKRSDNPNDPNWYQQAKLIASDAAERDMFGHYVSLSGDYAIVGAYANDDYGTNSGSAYIFKRNGNTWSEVYKITPPDGSAMDFLGRCVSIGSEYAIIGALHDDDKGPDSGSAYIFNKDCPTADLNGGCFVNFFDYAILANWWLQCN